MSDDVLFVASPKQFFENCQSTVFAKALAASEQGHEPPSQLKHPMALWVLWRESRFPVFDLSRHAFEELALTNPPRALEGVPFDAACVCLPVHPALPTLGWLWVAQCTSGVIVDPVPRSCRAGDYERYIVREGGRVRVNADCVPEMDLTRRVALNLVLALLVRPDDLIADELQTKRLQPAPRVTRIRMRAPIVGLTPHVQRFLIEGERAFRGRRSAYVMGHFRRAPGADAKTGRHPSRSSRAVAPFAGRVWAMIRCADGRQRDSGYDRGRTEGHACPGSRA